MTALHGAAHRAALDEIQLLVDHGAAASLTLESKPPRVERVGNIGLLPLDWALGVPVGVQSSIYHPDAVELISRLMKERGIPIPVRTLTLGGNAALGAKK